MTSHNLPQWLEPPTPDAPALYRVLVHDYDDVEVLWLNPRYTKAASVWHDAVEVVHSAYFKRLLRLNTGDPGTKEFLEACGVKL